MGCFLRSWGRSDIYIMDRDFESKKNGYSARSYIEVLNAMIITLWQAGMTFMQDNAPIHGARKVAAWFRDHNIPTMEWPPYSPDLNTNILWMSRGILLTTRPHAS